MTTLSAVETTFLPSEGAIPDIHNKRYEGFKELQALARKLRIDG
ncbi:hypothetical protein RLEG3_00495 (plasmid) [Rhizobium leguminosarum bv. trifolii WSM1689]|nr:hypothetical protein RLEG3_00495 [Rhizobium leguminosarum bv. trifolii WSM1689]